MVVEPMIPIWETIEEARARWRRESNERLLREEKSEQELMVHSQCNDEVEDEND